MQDPTLRQGCEEPQFVLVWRGVWVVFISPTQQLHRRGRSGNINEGIACKNKNLLILLN